MLIKMSCDDGLRKRKEKRMSDYNRVVMIGHLTKDPELRQLPSGSPVTDLGMAVNESYKDKNGQTVEKTCFIDVVAWARQAEACAQYLKKGSHILVEGRIQQDRWESDGKKHSRHKINADRIQFLDRKRDKPEQQPAVVGAEDDNVPF